MAEMAGTIQMLSGRGDMHAQASAARQDLQGERLTVHHLRSDVDSYRYRVEPNCNYFDVCSVYRAALYTIVPV